MSSDSPTAPWRVTEITGPPGTGKTSYARRHLSGYCVIAGYCKDGTPPMGRFLASLTCLNMVFWSRSLDCGKRSWLLRQARSLDEPIGHRINALRNAFLKFSSLHRFECEGELLIDEGVSHIPFILQLRKPAIRQFMYVFRQELATRDILFIRPPSSQELQGRLLRRGHRRVTSDGDLDRLIAKWQRVSNEYSDVLVETGLRVSFLTSDA